MFFVYIEFIGEQFFSLVLILRILGHVIQIVVHQFVHKTSTKKNTKSEKIDPPLSPGTREYVESVLRRKKRSHINPTYVKIHVESILGTRKNMTKQSIQFE